MNLRDAIRRLAGESLVYGLGQAGGRLIQILLVPILTRVFTPQAYGVIDLVMMIAAIATYVSMSGMDAALNRFFYEAPDRDGRRLLASTVATHRVAWSAFLGLLLVLFARPLSSLVLASPDYAKYIRLLGVTLPFTGFYLLANDALRITFQPFKYIALNGLNTLLAGGLTLYFVLVLHLSVAGVLYGKLVADVVASLVGLWLLRHTLAPRASWATLRRMLRYGLPFVPVALTYTVLTYADRQVLLRKASLDDVGVYAVAVKLAAPVMLAVTAFQLAWGPIAFAAATGPHAGRIYSRVLTLYTCVGVVLALGVALFAPEILAKAVPDAYHGAARAAGLLAFATVANGAFQIAAIGVNLAQRNEWLMATSGFAAAVTVGLALWWVGPWGGAGVAAATLCGFAASTVALYLVSQRLRPFPYRGTAALGVFAAGVVLALVAAHAGLAARAALWVAAAVACGLYAWRSRAPLARESGEPPGPPPILPEEPPLGGSPPGP